MSDLIHTIAMQPEESHPLNPSNFPDAEPEIILCRDQPDSCWDCTNEVMMPGVVCEECAQYSKEHA